MTVNHQWLERATLVAEYRACAEHYAALAAMNLDFAQREKPIELAEAARLNCEAIRARLTEHKNANPTV
jgi:hypothetical protein